MTHQFEVKWSKTARSDFFQIIQYLQQNNSNSAHIAYKKIQEKAQELDLFPERGRIVPELLAQGINLYRELIVPPWRIIYKIAGEQVIVLSVLDSRRNLEDLLLARLLGLNQDNFE